MGHDVEVRLEEPVEHQQDESDRDRREGKQDQHHRNQRHPGEDGHTHEAHPWRAHVDDGDKEVQGRGERGDAQDLQAEHPEVDARAGRKLTRGQVGVAKPTGVRRTAGQEAHVQQDAAKDERPVTECVQARERDVSGADLERDDEVEERGAHGHDRQEDHGRRVHGEQCIERFGGDQVVVRHPQLQADNHSFQAADHEERECGDPVQQADSLVVDRCEPAPQPTVCSRGELVGGGNHALVSRRGMRDWRREDSHQAFLTSTAQVVSRRS
jgi:hypothetical protein